MHTHTHTHTQTHTHTHTHTLTHIYLCVVGPSVSASPVSQTVLKEETAEFTCQAPGDPTPVITWLTSNLVNVELLGDSRIQV